MIYPELPLSFWSLTYVQKLMGARSVVPPLGLITVAALLPDDWELRLIDLNIQSLTEDDWKWADIVMVSGMIVQKTGVLELIRESKTRGKPVVAGGPYSSSIPGEVLDAGCDFVVRGEGENTVPHLVSALKEGKTNGIFENDIKPELDKSPVPRFDLLHMNKYLSLAFQTSRGCPFDCEFCDVKKFFGPKIRYKNPEQIIKEFDTAYDLGWRGPVFIADDNFI
ncbi:B12-binding domain-containing radical SAM protein, partial [Thermodesulfobacteriota bacterium]